MATWACAACGGENPEGMRFCGHCGSPAEVGAAATGAPTAPSETDVSDALRTHQTVAPLAAQLGLEPREVAAPAELIHQVLSGSGGEVVLVAGHSNTVPEIINGLGAPFPGPPLGGHLVHVVGAHDELTHGLPRSPLHLPCPCVEGRRHRGRGRALQAAPAR